MSDPLADEAADDAEDTEEEGLRDRLADLNPELPWSVQDADRAGAKIGDTLAKQTGMFVTNLLLLTTRLVPFSQKMWQGMIRAGYKGLLKTSGADAIGHISEQGRIRHEPMKFDREGGDGPVNDPRWITQNGDYYKSPSESEQTYLVGKVPAVWASSSTNHLGNHVQAEVAEVLDAEGPEPVMTDATVNHIEMEIDQGGDPQAVADGGTVPQSYVNVESPGVLDDLVVDLGVDGAGRVVSMEKYYETYPAVPGPEEMEQQHMMGRLAEKDPGADRSFIMKIMLIALGIIAIVVLGPPLVQALLGGGGGGAAPGSLFG